MTPVGEVGEAAVQLERALRVLGGEGLDVARRGEASGEDIDLARTCTA